MADTDKKARMAAVRKKAAGLKKKKGETSDAAAASSTAAHHNEQPTTPAPAEDDAEEQEHSATNGGDDGTDEKDTTEATENAAGTDEKNDDDDDDDVVQEKETAETAAGTDEKNDDAAAANVPGVADQPPSLAEQSRIRSTSFRMAAMSGSALMSPGPLSPEGGDTATDIYRKQVARIEELERENKRLAKEAGDASKRWAKVEEELAELREAEKGAGPGTEGGELVKVKTELAALQRQNAQLQQQLSKNTRHGSSPSVSTNTAELEAQLASKTATIESMELELSRLRAHAEKGTSAEKEQIAALEERLGRAETAAGAAQRELADTKKAVDQSARKAAQDSSEKTSAETKMRALEQEATEARRERDDLVIKVDGLEKKVATLTTLHREQDGRMHALRREKESLDGELAKHKSRKSVDGGGGLDDEGVDELENEVRVRLERRVRELEGEVHDLRRGVWRDRRRELDVTSPSAGGFENIDLNVGSPLGPGARRRQQTVSGGIGEFLTSGFNALTGGGGEDEGLLDDDDDFDEEAFRKAQEDMMMRRVERVREIKRGLKNWEGWRVDLVGTGGLGVGDIFEV